MKFTAQQQDAQKLAWAVGRNGLIQSSLSTIKSAAAALEGHPDDVSRDRILAEVARRDAAMKLLRAACFSAKG